MSKLQTKPLARIVLNAFLFALVLVLALPAGAQSPPDASSPGEATAQNNTPSPENTTAQNNTPSPENTTAENNTPSPENTTAQNNPSSDEATAETTVQPSNDVAMTLIDAQTRVSSSTNAFVRLRINAGDYKPSQLRLIASVREPITTVTQVTDATVSNDVGWVFSSSVIPVAIDESIEGPFEITFSKSLTDLYLHKWESEGLYPMHIALQHKNKQLAAITVVLTVSQNPIVPVAITNFKSADTPLPTTAVPSAVMWPLTMQTPPTLEEGNSAAFSREIQERLFPNISALQKLINLPVTVLTDPSILDDITREDSSETAKQTADIAQSFANDTQFSYLALPYGRADIEQLSRNSLYHLGQDSFTKSLSTLDSYLPANAAVEQVLVASYGYHISAAQLVNPQAMVVLEPLGLSTAILPYSTTNPMPVIIPEQGLYKVTNTFGHNAAVIKQWMEAASFVRYKQREPFVIALPPSMDPEVRVITIHNMFAIPWATMHNLDGIVKDKQEAFKAAYANPDQEQPIDDPNLLDPNPATYVQLVSKTIQTINAQTQAPTYPGLVEDHNVWLENGHPLPYKTAQDIQSLTHFLPKITDALGKTQTLHGYSSPQIANKLVRAATTSTGQTNFAQTMLASWQYLVKQVEILGQPPITLTASSGTIPIRLGNAAKQPVQVLVSVVSPGLYFPEGSEKNITVPPGAIASTEIHITAKNPGGLTPAIIYLKDPVSGQTVQEVSVPVRSSAYPLTALLLIAVSLLVLIVKVFQRWRAKAVRLNTEKLTTPIAYGP